MRKKLNLEDVFENQLEIIEPFKARDLLITYAKNKNKEIIDMSRGDPSYPPSPIVQKIFSYISILVTRIQEKIGDDRSVIWHLKEQVVSETVNEINKWLPEDFKKLEKEVNENISKIMGAVKPIKVWRNIIQGIQSTGYGDVSGEIEVRKTVSWYLKKTFKIKIPPENIILTLGAAEAIGKLFDAFADPHKLYHIKKEEFIGTFSPVYGPYNDIVFSPRIACECIPLNVRKENLYEPTDEDFQEFENAVKNKNLKIFILVSPNNPTGRIFSKKTLEKLSEILKEKGKCIIFEDIVYADFAKENFISISKFIPERTIIIGSLSKFFRATGNRLGYIAFPPECEEYLSEKLFKWTLLEKAYIYKRRKLRIVDYLNICKSPDPSGALSHTHLVPKVAQYLGMIKLIFDDGENYRKEMQNRWDYFYENIGLKEMINNKSKFVPYHCLVNFKEVILKRNNLQKLKKAIDNEEITPGQFLTYLAGKGLVAMPAGKFYIVKDNENPDIHWSARFSIVNVEMPHISKAVEIIKSSLDELNESLRRNSESKGH